MQSQEELFERAKKVAPGGVHSPVRSFRSVGGNPIFFKRAQGAYLYDTDNKEYVLPGHSELASLIRLSLRSLS